jgi:hypothetical protein
MSPKISDCGLFLFLPMKLDRRFWEIADYVKRRLFNTLREKTQSVNYLDYNEYQRAFEEIYDSLMDEWKKIQGEFKGKASFSSERLRGYLLEVLFYYACLKVQASLIDAEILEMDGVKLGEEYPAWFEVTPLYDIVAPLHHITQGDVRKRKAPQTRADFLVTYVDDSGPLAPSLVDVKSRKPRKWRAEWGWQVTASMRRGFTYQIAYPINGVKYPKNLEEWETTTPCSECHKLSQDPRKCSECGAEIYRFTIADAYYEAKELWKRLDKERGGRF